MRNVGVVAVMVIVGCGGARTDVLITVDNSAGSPAGRPGTVEVRLFDDHGVIGDATVAPVRLPGAVRVSDVPATAPQLRVVAAGYVGSDGREALLAATTLRMEMPTAAVALDLSPTFADEDGDAVPDALDDCPHVFDPNQERASGRGPGDVCR